MVLKSFTSIIYLYTIFILLSPIHDNEMSGNVSIFLFQKPLKQIFKEKLPRQRFPTCFQFFAFLTDGINYKQWRVEDRR